MFWRSPLYKPVTKICDEAWDEFIRTAQILMYMHFNVKPKRKNYPDFDTYEAELNEWEKKSPTIYSVFNKVRQDVHNELPYSENFISMIDKEVERDIKRERAASRSIAQLPEGT